MIKALLVVLMVMAFTVTTATAATTIAVTSDPVLSGQSYHVEVCGLHKGQDYGFWVFHPGGLSQDFMIVVADLNGCINGDFVAAEPGTYFVEVHPIHGANFGQTVAFGSFTVI